MIFLYYGSLLISVNSFDPWLIHTTLSLDAHTRTPWWETANLWDSLWSWHLSPPSLSSLSQLEQVVSSRLPPSQISIHTYIRWLADRLRAPPELIPLYIPSGSKRGLPSNCFLIPLSPLSLLYARLFSSKQHPQPSTAHPQPPPRSEHGSKGKEESEIERERLERERERRVCHWQGISAIFRVAGGCSPDPEDQDPGTGTTAGRTHVSLHLRGLMSVWADGRMSGDRALLCVSRAACMGTGGRVG